MWLVQSCVCIQFRKNISRLKLRQLLIMRKVQYCFFCRLFLVSSCRCGLVGVGVFIICSQIGLVVWGLRVNMGVWFGWFYCVIGRWLLECCFCQVLLGVWLYRVVLLVKVVVFSIRYQCWLVFSWGGFRCIYRVVLLSWKMWNVFMG